MKASTKLLNLAIDSVEAWSLHVYGGFIEDTSWRKHHSDEEHFPVVAINVFMDAIEDAIKFHAKNNSEWWCKNEPKLRQTKIDALLYFILVAYKDSPKSNLNGISD